MTGARGEKKEGLRERTGRERGSAKSWRLEETLAQAKKEHDAFAEATAESSLRAGFDRGKAKIRRPPGCAAKEATWVRGSSGPRCWGTSSDETPEEGGRGL